MSRITVIQDGVCLLSDNEIIRRALMSRTRVIENMLNKRYLSPNERLQLQDEYERTFALTEKYHKGEPP